MKKAKIDWKALKLKDRTATSVPKWVKTLSSEEYYERQEGFSKLRDLFEVGLKEWFDASVPLVDFLLSSLPKMTEPAYGLVLAADITAGGHTRFWAAGNNAKADKDCVDAMRNHITMLWSYLSDENPLTRCAATVALSVSINRSEHSEIAKLDQALENESDATVRSALLLCLSCLEDKDKFQQRIQTFLSNENGYVSGAAALCFMRANLKWNHETVSSAIDSLLNLPPTTRESEEGRWAWFDGLNHHFNDAYDSSDPATIALFALVEFHSAEAKNHLVDLLFKVGESSTNILVRDRCSGLLAFIGGMERREYPCLTSKFTQEQWTMAQKFARSRLCADARYGMPAAGIIRQRWAGISKPGPLDTLVENFDNPNSEKIPLWYAWIKYRGTGLGSSRFGNPPQLASFPDPLDRWQIIVEFSSGAYQYSTSCSEEEIEEILKSIVNDKNFYDRIKQLIEEQVWRIENDNWVGNGTFSQTFVYLTLLPWIRAGKAVPNSWARLIDFKDSNHCREILQALPVEQRDHITMIQLSEDLENCALDVFERLTLFLPLLGTPIVIPRLLEVMLLHRTELNGWGASGKRVIATIKKFAESNGYDVVAVKKKKASDAGDKKKISTK